MWRDVGPFLVGWAYGWLLGARPLRLPASPPEAARPPVAVIVPARDEAAALPALLASLTAQLGLGDELVVVDDDSADATAAVAAAHGARVVAAPALEPGWTGKAHACAVGADVTAAPVVAFVDADVVVASGALDRLVRAAAARPDALVTVQPWHDMRRPYEQLSVPFTIVAGIGTGLAAPWGARMRPRVAYGPLLVTTRAAYTAAGGHAHAEVRGSVVEDIALARRYDGRVVVASGRGIATFRMYPGGVRPLVEGWSKNIAAGAASVPRWALVLTAAWVWSIVGAPGAAWWCWLASAAQVWLLGRRWGRVRWWAALAAPLLGAWFVAMLVWSTWRRLRGGTVRWRGRDVAAGPARRA
jgi:4,4'-diaponeurosporenoate glycosyltransferase